MHRLFRLTAGLVVACAVANVHAPSAGLALRRSAHRPAAISRAGRGAAGRIPRAATSRSEQRQVQAERVDGRLDRVRSRQRLPLSDRRRRRLRLHPHRRCCARRSKASRRSGPTTSRRRRRSPTTTTCSTTARRRPTASPSVGVRPKRKDVLLVEGAIFVQPSDGELSRIEGKLSKTPSFWTRRVDVVRRYERKAGVRVPMSIESVAQRADRRPLDVQDDLRVPDINGQTVGDPQVRRRTRSRQSSAGQAGNQAWPEIAHESCCRARRRGARGAGLQARLRAGATRCGSRAAVVRRTRHLARRRDDRLRQRRRHLGGARARRRRAAAGVASRDRVAPAVLARRNAARLHLDAHRQRRRLRADARHRRRHAAHVRRCDRAGERLVARRPVGSVPVEQPRDLRHDRRLPRQRRRRHADAGRGRSLHDRVLRRAVARRRSRRDHRARQRRRAVVAQRAQPSRRERDLDRATGGRRAAATSR